MTYCHAEREQTGPLNGATGRETVTAVSMRESVFLTSDSAPRQMQSAAAAHASLPWQRRQPHPLTYDLRVGVCRRCRLRTSSDTMRLKRESGWLTGVIIIIIILILIIIIQRQLVRRRNMA